MAALCPDPCWRAKANIIAMNRFGLDMFGYSREEIVGECVYASFPYSMAQEGSLWVSPIARSLALSLSLSLSNSLELSNSTELSLLCAPLSRPRRNVSILMPSPFKDLHRSFIARFHDTGVKRIIDQRKRMVEAVGKHGVTFNMYLSVTAVECVMRPLPSLPLYPPCI